LESKSDTEGKGTNTAYSKVSGNIDATTNVDVSIVRPKDMPDDSTSTDSFFRSLPANRVDITAGDNIISVLSLARESTGTYKYDIQYGKPSAKEVVFVDYNLPQFTLTDGNGATDNVDVTGTIIATSQITTANIINISFKSITDLKFKLTGSMYTTFSKYQGTTELTSAMKDEFSHYTGIDASRITDATVTADGTDGWLTISAQ
jgi:hypothetical protein